MHAVLISLEPPRLTFGGRLVGPAQLLSESGLTERWRRRQISNYDYLMMLNTIAGELEDGVILGVWQKYCVGLDVSATAGMLPSHEWPHSEQS